MRTPVPRRRGSLPALLGASLLALALPVATATGGAPDADFERVLLLEQQAVALGAQIDALSGVFDTLLPRTDSAEPVLVAQNSQEGAALTVRLQQLEEQMRLMTGQLEGLQFQMTQLQTLITRMQEDNEFRFQQLEGGGSGNGEAAIGPAPVTPEPQLPQSPASTPDPIVADLPPDDPGMPMDQMATPLDPQTLDPGPILPQAGTPVPPGEVGESRDPLLSGGQPQLGQVPESDLANLGTNQPLDLSFDPRTQTPANADAEAQYKAGYDAVLRGDYAFAERQFSQFIALYPDHPQASEATNWLGDALLQRGAFDEAADVLLTGWQTYPNAPRAPDMLMKLGIALARAGELETACRTFSEVERRYPTTTPPFQERLTQEMTQASC